MGNNNIQGYPLSPQQKRLWQLQQLAQNCPHYTACCTVMIEGNLYKESLEAAIQNVIQRYEILRTIFPSLTGMTIPLQVITDYIAPLVQYYDLVSLPDEEQRSKIAELLLDLRHLPFSFEKGPLVYITIAQLSQHQHVLLLCLSALCADDRTLKSMIHEISKSYDALMKKEAIGIETMQYADLSVWQNELLALEEGRAYWNQLKMLWNPSLQLPRENLPDPKLVFYPHTLSVLISDNIMADIEEFVQTYNTSIKAFILTCWQTLLMRLTRQSDITVGVACDGRTYEELAEVLGPLTKFLPFPCQIEDNLPFTTLLRQVEVLLHDIQHQQAHFSMEAASELPYRAESIPFFSACFVFDDQIEQYSAAGITFSLENYGSYIDRFKVNLSCRVERDHLVIEFHYDSSAFQKQAMKFLTEELQTLIASALKNPEVAVSELRILGLVEQQLMLTGFNETHADYPANVCFHHLFEEQVERTPENIAAVFGDQRLTYAELNAFANRLASHLQEIGVGPEILVSICLERSLDLVIAVIAVLKAGGAYVPLDPTYPHDRFVFILKDASINIVVTQTKFLSNFQQTALLHRVCLDADRQIIEQKNAENPACGTTSQNAAYVIYTSGSTGKPKGVVVEHNNLLSYLYWVNNYLLNEEINEFPVIAELTFDASLKQLFAPLLQGRQIWILPREVITQPSLLLQEIASKNKIGLNCVPSLWATLLDAIKSRQVTFPDSSLTHLFLGGERLNADLIRQTFTILPHLQIWNLYGPTEATANASFAQITSPEEITIGRPITNTQIYLLDEDLNLVPLGIPGEIYIGGDGLARGYLNRPELMRERFIPHPFNTKPGVRLYRTGDLARYRLDGTLEFIGRLDTQIKLHGYRIELGEIEAVLSSHSDVQEAIVLADENEAEDTRLVAYILSRNERHNTISMHALRYFLQDMLPSYMVPTIFVLLKELPLMPNGKVDRKALPDPLQQRSQLKKDFVAPRNLEEETLAKIWCQVLDIERVSIHDDFFELGGTSLSAIKLATQFQNQIGRLLPLALLFQKRSIAALAMSLQNKSSTMPSSPLITIQPEGTKPPFFCVHSGDGGVLCYIELAQLLGTDQPFYGLQAAGISGEREPYSKIEDMAAYYIEALQSIQADGPYFLGGWSFGGSVAFEMAQQLHRRGQRVNLLALLDSRAPTACNMSIYHGTDMIARFAKDLAHGTENLVSGGGLQDQRLEDRLHLLLEDARQANVVPSDIEFDQFYQIFCVFQANMEAWLSYKALLYPGPVTIFHASDDRLQASDDSTLGWEQLVTGNIQTHAIPGNHYTIVKRPQIETLASKLSHIMEHMLTKNTLPETELLHNQQDQGLE